MGSILKKIFLITMCIFLPLTIFAEEKKSWGITPLPIIAYSPETGILGGAFIMYYYNPDPNSQEQKLNTIRGAAFYTQKNQLQTTVNTDWYFGRGDYNLSASFSFSKFPGTFYGIGPNTSLDMEEEYTPIGFDFSGSFRWKVIKNLYLGPMYYLSFINIIEMENNGLLDSGDICGSDGTVISGFGPHLTLDQRDNNFYTLKGFLLDLKAGLYRQEIGSEENFYKLILDYRHFFKIYGQHVLGLQYLITLSAGTVPFQALPQLGGVNMMRGYYRGRYLDKIFTALQAEYRFPIFWRFGGDLFGSIGQVAPAISDFAFDSLKACGGAGLRFAIQTEPKMNLRLDFAFPPTAFNSTSV